MSRNESFVVDSLEPRQLMANVGVQLAGGLLQIAGTSSADALTLSVSGNDLLVKGAAGTTINGSTAGVKFAKFSVTSISAVMGNGDDKVTLDGVDQGLGGTLDTGSGDDVISLYRARLTGMLVQAGTGDDMVNLLGTTMQSVVIDTAAGDDAVNVLGTTVFNFSSVVLGDGNDSFIAVKNTVFGFTSVDGGAGRDLAIGLFNDLPGGKFLTGFEYRFGI